MKRILIFVTVLALSLVVLISYTNCSPLHEARVPDVLKTLGECKDLYVSAFETTFHANTEDLGRKCTECHLGDFFQKDDAEASLNHILFYVGEGGIKKVRENLFLNAKGKNIEHLSTHQLESDEDNADFVDTFKPDWDSADATCDSLNSGSTVE